MSYLKAISQTIAPRWVYYLVLTLTVGMSSASVCLLLYASAY